MKLSVFSAGLGFNRIYFLRAKVTLPYGKLARLHFFFYLNTINSQWTLNRVSCSKKEKMADGLCQWNIGIQVDRASSPFVFLNAPFYTKGVQSSLLLNFWHLFDAWIARAMQTWKIAVTGSRFMGLNFHDRHWSGCSERDRGWMNDSEEVPSAFALLLI